MRVRFVPLSSGSAASALLITGTKTDVGGWTSLNADQTYNYTSATTSQNRGIFAQPRVGSSNTANWTNADGALVGVLSIPTIHTSSTGTFTSVIGFRHQLSNPSGTYAITNAHGARFDAPSSTGPVTNLYGVTIAEQSVSGTTIAANLVTGGTAAVAGSWNIYAAGTRPSSFGGPVANRRTDTASAATIAELTPTSGFHKLTGSTATTIQTITAGVDGQQLEILNLTGANMTILHDDGATGTAANRITSLTGASIVTTGNGSVRLRYDTGSSRWIVMSATL